MSFRQRDDLLFCWVESGECTLLRPEVDLLCGYGQALARLLSERRLSPEMEPTLAGLLFDLVVYFADELRAPRWIRTADGVKFIEESNRIQEH